MIFASYLILLKIFSTVHTFHIKNILTHVCIAGAADSKDDQNSLDTPQPN